MHIIPRCKVVSVMANVPLPPGVRLNGKDYIVERIKELRCIDVRTRQDELGEVCLLCDNCLAVTACVKGFLSLADINNPDISIKLVENNG